MPEDKESPKLTRAFTLRVSQAEHDEVTQAAAEEDRKPAELIRHALRQYLRARKKRKDKLGE